MERSPLLPNPSFPRTESGGAPGYGTRVANGSRSSRESSRAGAKEYNVNYPPSVPGSPTFGPTEGGLDMSFGDVMIRHELARGGKSPERESLSFCDGDRSEADDGRERSPSTQPRRRGTMALLSEGPEAFGTSEVADDEARADRSQRFKGPREGRRGRRRAPWPNLAVLEEYSHDEMESRTSEGRAKRITEPQLINGRLRPVGKGWYHSDEDAPYRFTYFNGEASSSIHSQTLSELAIAGGSFRELFIPEPPVLSDESSDSEDDNAQQEITAPTPNPGPASAQREGVVSPARASSPQRNTSSLGTTQIGSEQRGDGTPQPISPVLGSSHAQSPSPSKGQGSIKSMNRENRPRYGDRPIWWLDVLCPTEAEMEALTRAFGLHPLTSEDIVYQEEREKVELFRNYYFVTYRTFDHDESSENFLQPFNMYAVVFREGVITFHFSMTPHPSNVRRRIRQFRDYMIMTADWISYAIIDDITDAFVPIIKSVEQDIQAIDDTILRMLLRSARLSKGEKDVEDGGAAEDGSEVLIRVDQCLTRVLNIYGMLNNKADVIKGFAKKCNERWDVAPKSEIGLYLGDITDHIVTMVSNLNQYERRLEGSRSNCLAAINLKMNERAEQTADGLNKLTVLGTIVLPMNIITGLWGMNVWVPGQELEGSLKWFFWICFGLSIFGLVSFWGAKVLFRV